MFTRWFVLIFIIFLFTTASISNFAYADFDKGLEAFDEGDYETALQEWMVDAEQGNPDAQYNLGVMYESGYGVPENDAEAVKWLGSAALQGHAKARADLARMYVCLRLGVLEFGYAHITVGNGARGDINSDVFNMITRTCSRAVLSNGAQG